MLNTSKSSGNVSVITNLVFEKRKFYEEYAAPDVAYLMTAN